MNSIKIIILIFTLSYLNISIYGKSYNHNDTLRAYQNLYNKYHVQTTTNRTPITVTIQPKQQKNQSFTLDPIDEDEFEDPGNENPIEELKKIWSRVQRDIAIKKRSIESVEETVDVSKRTIVKVLREAYRNFSDAIKNEQAFNFSAQHTQMGEFPYDFMTDRTRESGGFIVHIIIFSYFSLVLAFICDKYFLKSLEYICEVLAIPSDVGGATFMAIGTSAPELFTSIIGVFISDNDIGTGTIVGSAVFNLLVIPGACGYAAFRHLSHQPKISPFPIMRDSLFYILTIITLILCLKDNQVDW